MDNSSFIRLELSLDLIDVKVQVGKHCSKAFATSKGVLQSDSLIPLLVILHLWNTVARVFIAPEERYHDYGNHRIRFTDEPSLSVFILQYADDIAHIDQDLEKLDQKTYRYGKNLPRACFTVNHSKTEARTF